MPVENEETKYKLVVEYLGLCRQFIGDAGTEQKFKIKIRLNEIRKNLNMELI